MRFVKKLCAILLGLCCLSAFGAEVMPPAPAQYFNDYAHVVSSATAATLNQRLEQFERDNSSQIVVAIFPTMQTDSSIEDYTFRVKQAWKVGQKGKDNGAALFVFTQDRKMFLQVGYGLEGALPDALCKRIIEDEIKPHFKAGDFDGGLTAGVNAMLAATKGEYKGTGRTVAEGRLNSQDLHALLPLIVFVGFFGLVFFLSRKVRSHGGNWHGVTISSGGYSSGGWSSGGSSWSGGGGGGGGFSGGGGGGGGGGAGGSW